MGAIDLSAALWPETDQGRQPQGIVAVDPALGLHDVYMPSLGIGSLAAAGQLTANETYFRRQLTPTGIAYGHAAGGLYTAAATLPAAGTYAAVLMVLGAAANGSNQSTLIGNSSAGLREQSGSLVYRCASSSVLTATLPRGPGSVIFASWRNGQHILYHRDPTGAEEYYSTTATWGNASPLDLLTEAGRAIVLLARWRDSVPPLAIQQALVRAPWSLVTPTAPMLFWASPVGAADLAGDATAQASASADLATGIPILGAALAVSSGSAALTTGIPVQGLGAALSSAGGALTAEIRLDTDALASALAAAALSSGIILTTEAVGQAAAQGQLDNLIALLGAAAASSSATGSLDTAQAGADLAGVAVGQAAASVSITVQILMDAAALAAAAAAAGLDTGIPLAGAAGAQIGRAHV